MKIKVVTTKYDNCDALQLNATRRRVSRSGLQLRGPKCTGVQVQEFRNLLGHLMQSRNKLKRNSNLPKISDTRGRFPPIIFARIHSP